MQCHHANAALTKLVKFMHSTQLLKPYLFGLVASCVCFLSWGAETAVSGSTLLQATKISSQELATLLQAGTQVETYNPTTGSIRHWDNNPGGKFVASREGGPRNAKSTGSGSWRLSDDGNLYCVEIDWRTGKNAPDNTESWCRALYRYEGELYFAPDNLQSHLEQKYSVVRLKQ